MKDPIKRQKHLEACRKWRENNRDKFRKISLESYYRKKAENPKEYLAKHSEIARQYRIRNIEVMKKKEKEKSRLRRLNSYEKDFKYMKKYLRERTLAKIYNLTPEQYEQIYQNQAGKCAICNMSFGSKTPHTDHCHKTKKVRGLLCMQCNVILGMIEKKLLSNVNLMSTITEYLK